MAFVSAAGLVATAAFAHVVEKEGELEESIGELAMSSKGHINQVDHLPG
jgi:hypothetical protein